MKTQMFIFKFLFLLLVSSLLPLSLQAQLEGTGIVVTDPGINRINRAAASQGGTITDIPKASSGSSLASVLIDGVRQGSSVYVGLSSSVDMVMDLGDTHIVDTVQLNFYEPNNNHFRYQILGSVDGIDYEMLIDKSTGEHYGKQIDTFEPVSLRYIKVLPVSSSRSDNLVFLQDEILVLSSVVVSPLQPQTLVIDSVEDGGTGNEDGQKLTLHSGIYHVEFVSGAGSPWSDDSSNGGKAWDTRLQVYVKGTNKSYDFGFIHNFLSRFATPTEAEDASRDHSFMIHVPFETEAYFKYPVSNPANTRGSQTYKLTQVSGPNESRLVQVRDAILRSIIWQEKEVAKWENWLTTGNRNCFGCHVQTQTSVGINETKARLLDLPYNKRLEEEFVDAYPRWQNSSGWVSPFHNGNYKVTQTSLWAWAVSTFRGENFETLLPNLVKAVDYLRGTQQANGGWNADHNSADSARLYSDGTPSATHTTGNIQAFMKVVSQLRDDTIVPFTSATVTGGQVELGNNEGNIHELEVSPVDEVTAVRLLISDSFDAANGGFVVNEFEAFNVVEKHTVSSSDANTSDPLALIDESHDGDSSDINNGWGNGSENVRDTNAAAIWVFQDPVRIDRIVLSQIFPDKQLKNYTIEYTTADSPTLSSSFTEFSITGAGTASGAAVAPYVDSVRNAATLYASDSWNYSRNVRTTAQTIIGLYVALPVLEGDLAEAALDRIVEARDLLRSAQLTSGGWSTSTGGTGSPLAYQSAQAMYALLLVADEDLDDDLLRGVDYLINSQSVDGSWTFPGLARRLASTTWVEIALPLIFEKLNEQFSRDTITNVQATGLLNSVEVSWSPVDGATGYNVYRRGVDGSFQLVAENHQSDIATFLDTDVQVETTYLYMVRWLNSAGGESADSNEDSGTPSGLVCGGDTPPDIVSDPVVEGLVGHKYRYQVEATDNDEGDVLTYSLPTAPEGMEIDPSTGLITWTPASDQLGSHFVRVWVADKIGRFATQAYRVTAARVFVNEAPEFKSQPVREAVAGYQYVYKAKAVDPNIGDILTYEKASGPAALVINDTTGRVRWTPSSGDIGTVHDVSLTVTDANNLGDSQTYQINVLANQKPTIDSTPVTQGVRGLSYFYQVEATDPEKGQLLYSLSGAPEGMRIHRATGRVTWNPSLDTIGDFPITVIVTDEGGLTDTQNYVLNVPDNTPPQFQSDPLTEGAVGYPYSYDSNATDIETPDLRYELTSGPSGMSISASTGVVSWQPSSAGTYSVLLSVFDGEGLKDEQSYDVTVTTTGSNIPNTNDGQPGGTFPPGAPDGNVLSPEPFSVIKETTPVRISVTDPDLDDGVEVEWSVELRREGDSEGATLGSGTGPEVNTTAGTIEPSALADDMYRIYLHLTYGSKTYSKWFPYEIKTRVKLGVYQTSVTDLEIPLAGMPISIIRDYTSADTKKYQFGHGWRLRYPGRVVDSASEAPLTAYTAGTRVFVTLPDGQRVGFTFEPYAQSFLFSFLQTPYFRPDAGVFATLEVDPESVTPSGGAYYHFLGGAYNPSKFYLTTRDRIRYTIVEGKGITEIRDANFNSLTFTDNAITHSSGEAIQVQRDGNGNITKLSAPGGAVVLYTYDAHSDMIGYKDMAGDQWRYTYDTNHRLKTVVNPDGTTLLENFYNSEGHLFKQVDANGNELAIEIDTSENTQSVVDRRGNKTVYDYDSSGNLVAVVDADGKTTSFEYDENFNITQQVDRNGQVTEWDYNASGKIASMTDAADRTTSFAYNDLSQPTKITYPDGSVYTRSYDARGNLLSTTDPSGRSTSASYDSQGRILTMTNPLSSEVQFEYDSNGRILQSRGEDGLVQRYTYDSRGNLLTLRVDRTDNDGILHQMITRWTYDDSDRPITRTDAEGVVASVSWNEFNKPSLFKDGRGYEFLFDYDSAGNLTEILYPDGSKLEYEYDAEFNEVLSRDRNGNVTNHEYDKLGRKVKTIYADNSVETYEYDAEGNLTAHTNTRTHLTKYRYDQVNRRAERETPRGAVSRQEFDVLNNVVKGTDPLGRATSSTYDVGGRLAQEILPDGGIISHSYNLAGLETRRTDPLGNTYQYSYDDSGRMTKLTDPLGHDTRKKYDEVGNLLQIIDAEGGVTKLDYDNRGRLIRKIDPTGEQQKWLYDENGNLKSHTDTSGNTTTYEYDFNNNKTRVIEADGDVTNFKYDAVGNVTSVEDPSGNVISFEYDKRNKRTVRRDALGKATLYEYDALGNLVKMTDRLGRIKEYAYNEDNQLVSEKWLDSTEVLVSEKKYEYDLAGNQTLAVSPEASYRYVYDEMGAVIGIDTTGSSSIPEFKLSKEYDDGGNLVTIYDDLGTAVRSVYDKRGDLVQRSLEDPSFNESLFEFIRDKNGNAVKTNSYLSLDKSTQWFTHDSPVDSTGRQLMSKYDQLEGTSIVSENYTYDSAGRLKEIDREGEKQSFTYDVNHQLVNVDYSSFPDESFSYDSSGNRNESGTVVGVGNRIQEDSDNIYVYDDEGNTVRITSKSDSSYVDFNYDHDNQLISALMYDSGGIQQHSVEYVYDVFGRRIKRIVDGSVEVFTHDGEDIWSDFGPTQNKRAQYLNGQGVDNLLAVHSDDGSREAFVKGNLNSVIGTINQAGSLVNEITYSAFGEKLASSGGEGRYGFTSREYDSQLGKYYSRARMYDPSLGRFLTEDPLGLSAGDFNLYRYGYNAPTVYSDPSGKNSATTYAVGVTILSAALLSTVSVQQLTREKSFGNAIDLSDFSFSLQSAFDQAIIQYYLYFRADFYGPALEISKQINLIYTEVISFLGLYSDAAEVVESENETERTYEVAFDPNASTNVQGFITEKTRRKKCKWGRPRLNTTGWRHICRRHVPDCPVGKDPPKLFNDHFKKGTRRPDAEAAVPQLFQAPKLCPKTDVCAPVLKFQGPILVKGRLEPGCGVMQRQSGVVITMYPARSKPCCE